MPIFEYKCPKCGNEFEELVFGSEVPKCPSCGEKETHRLVSCACVHMPGPSRVGQTVSFPTSGGGCKGCSGGNCSTCK